MEKSILSNRAYDVLKWICIIVLPALATLYRGVGTIWSLPYVEEIPQTIIVIDAFIGALLGVSTIQYNKNNE